MQFMIAERVAENANVENRNRISSFPSTSRHCDLNLSSATHQATASPRANVENSGEQNANENASEMIVSGPILLRAAWDDLTDRLCAP